MAFTLGKFNSPKTNRQIAQEDQQPQFSHFVPKLSAEAQFKQKVLVQNKALARKNSTLMTKITDLENKVSDLIQQNIELRAVNAKSEDQKRKWLEDKLNVIEEGVNQRFSEMLQMFQTIRENEGLSISTVQLHNSHHVVINSSIENSTTSDKSVSFQLAKSPKKLSKSERRRKSLRRQSIFIVPPDSPVINEQAVSLFDSDTTRTIFDKNVELFPTLQQPTPFEAPPPKKIQFQPGVGADSNEEFYYENGPAPASFDNSENPFQDQVNLQVENTLQEKECEEVKGDSSSSCDKQQSSDPIDEPESMELSQASNLSPIKISSASSSLEAPTRAKFAVYEDSPKIENTNLFQKLEKLASDSILDNKSTTDAEKSRIARKSLTKKSLTKKSLTKKSLTHVSDNEQAELSDKQKPLSQDPNKVKHTKATKLKSKFISDDRMPGPTLLDSADEPSTRRSRNRGKPISYAEPSLRAKMRRQSEKFIAAADEGAYDAYVNNILVNRRRTISPDVSKEIETTSGSSEEVSTAHPLPMYKAQELVQNAKDSRVSPAKPKRSLIEEDSGNVTKKRKPLGALNSNKVATKSSNSLEKGGLKQNVVGIDPDESDLSVFDLVEETAAGVPKTTYKGNPEVKLSKRKSSTSGGRRHSLIM